MNYQDIQRVNGEITMLPLKGKDYAMVPERVTAFRKLFPDGFITTQIVEHDGTTVLMQATAGYRNADGISVILGTGYAQEVKGKGMVNSTSYIENCETSAVGRALGFLGLGINGGGICSAEELANAITAQRQMAEEKPTKDEMAEMSTVRTQILGLAKGDIDALNGLIEKWSNGKYKSLDGMPLADMKNLKLAIVKAKQGAEK